MNEAVRDPDSETDRIAAQTMPPMMAYSDVVRDLVVQMSQMGVGGNLKIAPTLARAGIKLSKKTARRWRNKRGRPPRPGKDLKALGPVLTAKRPNHLWMLDITHIRGLFGLFNFRLAVVIDVFSRMPLLGQVFITGPTAEEMAGSVAQAATNNGAPKHFVTDKGCQFTSPQVRHTLKSLGVRQRFGAIGKSGSIRRSSRFWRTVKKSFRLKLRPPLTPVALQER